MTVLSSTFNLSDNVKYINFKIDTTPSGGGAVTSTTTLSDRKSLMHIIQRAISTEIDETAVSPTSNHLGWQRFDGADSAGDVVHDPVGDNDSAVYGFLRARCYDYDTSGHYKYLKLKMFERDEKTLPANEFNDLSRGPRYSSSDNVLVLRYEMYSDWDANLLTNMLDSSVTHSTSWTADSAIAAGSGLAEADGFGKMDGSIAYEANSWQWNAARFGTQNHGANLDVWNTIYNDANFDVNSAAGGIYPKDGSRGNSSYYDVFYDRYGQTGFGHADLSVKNSYNELKFLIDGHSTLWLFGDQASSAANVNAASGTETHNGVDSNADARYLIMHNTQHQDDDPEKTSEYNTILFASEYKKEFGEAAPSGQYIHNGLKTNLNSLLMHNGVATPPNYFVQEKITNNSGSITVSANQLSLGNLSFSSEDGNAFFETNNNVTAGNLTSAEHFYSSSNYTNDVQDFALNPEPDVYELDAGFSANYRKDNDNTTVNFAADSYNGTYANDGNYVNVTTAEPHGNILMGHSNITNISFTSGTGLGTIENASLSNVRSHTLGNHLPVNTRTNDYGGSSYQGWDNTTATNGTNVIVAGGHLGREMMWVGADGAQFALTEYPTRSTSTLRGEINNYESMQTFDGYDTPSSGREYLSATRLHMGWLGYVGHLNKFTSYSLNELFFGSRHGLFGDDGSEVQGSLSEYIPGDPDAAGRVSTYGPSIPLTAAYVDSADGNTIDAADASRESFQEFHPTPEVQTSYSVYEPILSVGTMRMHGGGSIESQDIGATTTAGDTNFYANNETDPIAANHAPFGEFGNPGGTAKKQSAFAMLGRTYGLKIFGPYTPNKYNYLDTVSIQLDDDGFYAVNPSNSVEHWVLPMNNAQCSLLVKK